MTDATPITHAEATEIAGRLVKSAWRRDGQVLEPGERFVTHIPARPDLDDDIRVFEYIKQQEAKGSLGRYIAFAFDCYYPDGGVNDLVGFFDRIDDVLPAVLAKYPDWSKDSVHVIDAWTGKVTVYEGQSAFGQSPFYALVENWKGDQIRGGTALIEPPEQVR